MAESINLLDTQQLCRQRTRRQMMNAPPPRNELISPYPQYTQKQLDMRRKVEILKYSASNSNTKTNNLTRAERFAQIVQNSQRRNYNQYYLEKIALGIEDCSADDYLASNTSASGVPGPIETLRFDPNVPLYNYSNPSNSDTAPSNSQPDTPVISIPSSIPVIIKSGEISNIVCTLRTYSILPNNILNTTFVTPVSISVGNIVNSFVYVYYNDILVDTNDPDLSKTVTPTTPSLSLKSTPVVAHTNTSLSTTVKLFAQPGFLYDFRFKIILSESNAYLTFNV